MDLSVFSKYVDPMFLEIDSIIDIGVSDGQFLHNSVNYFPNVLRRIGIDPVDYPEYERWKAIEYHSFAVGPTCGLVDFYETIDRVGSSVFEASGKKRIVKQMRRDCFLKNEFELVKMFVKLDTQGTEIECLKSFGLKLGQVRAVQIESWMKPYGGFGRYFEDTISEIGKLGFFVVEIFDALNRPKDGRLGQVDLLCLNKQDKTFTDLDWNW